MSLISLNIQEVIKKRNVNADAKVMSVENDDMTS